MLKRKEIFVFRIFCSRFHATLLFVSSLFTRDNRMTRTTGENFKVRQREYNSRVRLLARPDIDSPPCVNVEVRFDSPLLSRKNAIYKFERRGLFLDRAYQGL